MLTGLTAVLGGQLSGTVRQQQRRVSDIKHQGGEKGICPETGRMATRSLAHSNVSSSQSFPGRCGAARRAQEKFSPESKQLTNPRLDPRPRQ